MGNLISYSSMCEWSIYVCVHNWLICCLFMFAINQFKCCKKIKTLLWNNLWIIVLALCHFIRTVSGLVMKNLVKKIKRLNWTKWCIWGVITLTHFYYQNLIASSTLLIFSVFANCFFFVFESQVVTFWLTNYFETVFENVSRNGNIYSSKT